MYKKYVKRGIDFILSLVALIVLSPLLILLTIIGMIAMGGNPFFVQKRPGKKDKDGNEVIFNLIKFRTMNNKKDKNGKLLSDEVRLTKYGRFLRSTSLDELPELLNILNGSLALIGPRPLLPVYIGRYSTEQRRRHDVRPGLTGYAQAYGRNSLTWEEKFKKDIYYVDHISFFLDLQILLKTIEIVIKREGISSEGSATMEEFMGSPERVEK